MRGGGNRQGRGRKVPPGAGRVSDAPDLVGHWGEPRVSPVLRTPQGEGRERVPCTRIERIVKEEVGLTPGTALRLATFLDTTPEFWMKIQTA